MNDVEQVGNFNWKEAEKTEVVLKWTPDLDLLTLNPYQRSLLELYDGKIPDIKPIEKGEIIEGEIHQISRKEIQININYKDFVYVDNTSTDWKFVKNLVIGDDIQVLITDVTYKPHYRIKGSISELIRLSVENDIKDFYEESTPIEAKIINRNSAGFILKLQIRGIEIDAFMPNTIAAPNKMTDAQASEMLGETITVCLETLKEDRKGLYVVSRKKYLKKYVFPKEVKKLEIGEKVYRGHITGTTKFGVFVEFNGCLTGMIHKVNINPSFKITDLKAGMIIEFYVKDVVKGGTEIILTQILRESLWDKLKVGNNYDVEIISVKPFGCLAKLDEETFGLIQNSYLKKSNRKLEVKEKVEVKVINFNREERKIYLDFSNKEKQNSAS
jgi:small subunit ribosomal protein S1